jgi:hypothetical protein
MSNYQAPSNFPAAPPPPGLPNSSLAIVSLVTGILGLTLLPILGSIIALITGYMARNEIRDSAGALGGDSLALVGLVLGWIGVGLTVIGLCIGGVFILIPACLLILGISTQTTSLLWLLVV